MTKGEAKQPSEVPAPGGTVRGGGSDANGDGMRAEAAGTRGVPSWERIARHLETMPFAAQRMTGHEAAEIVRAVGPHMAPGGDAAAKGSDAGGSGVRPEAAGTAGVASERWETGSGDGSGVYVRLPGQAKTMHVKIGAFDEPAAPGGSAAAVARATLAAAAPEMLKALRPFAAGRCTWGGNATSNDCLHAKREQPCRTCVARAAIAKATTP